MKPICHRLTRGCDLYLSLKEVAKRHSLSAGAVVSLVGCVSELSLRLAGGKDFLYNKNHYEIVSATGTISEDRIHVHAAFSDIHGNTVGGHLKEGTIVDTTCEVVILPLAGYHFSKIYDETTGYNELLIKELEADA